MSAAHTREHDILLRNLHRSLGQDVDSRKFIGILSVYFNGRKEANNNGVKQTGGGIQS